MAEAIKLKRGMILDLDLDPTKGSETGKTRPIDYCSRLISIRGELELDIMLKIDQALRIVFAL